MRLLTLSGAPQHVPLSAASTPLPCLRAVEAFGLQCYETTHFVRAHSQIDTRAPLLLFQLSVVGVSEVHYLSSVYVPGVKGLQHAPVEVYGGDQT